MNIALTRARTGLIGRYLTSCRSAAANQLQGSQRPAESGRLRYGHGCLRAVSRLDAWMLSRRYDKTPPRASTPCTPRRQPRDASGGDSREERPQHLLLLPCSHHRTGQPLPERASQVNAMPAPPVRPGGLCRNRPLGPWPRCPTLVSRYCGHSRSSATVPRWQGGSRDLVRLRTSWTPGCILPRRPRRPLLPPLSPRYSRPGSSRARNG